MGEVTAIALVTIAFSIIAAVFSLITYRSNIVHDRCQATLEAYNQLQEQALDYLNHYMPAEMREIAKRRQSDEYKQVSAYIARIEHFCVSVNLKIYDRSTVYKLAHGYFEGSLKRRIAPIIDQKNQNGEDYYSNIRKVYAWMEKRGNSQMRKSK